MNKTLIQEEQVLTQRVIETPSARRLHLGFKCENCGQYPTVRTARILRAFDKAGRMPAIRLAVPPASSGLFDKAGRMPAIRWAYRPHPAGFPDRESGIF